LCRYGAYNHYADHNASGYILLVKTQPINLWIVMHDCFLAWFEQSRALFKAPPSIVDRSNRTIELTFGNWETDIRVYLNTNKIDEIAVTIYWDNVLWDLLLCLETYPKKTKHGFICELCRAHDSSSSVTYPTLNALWESHLFQPFLDWVNNTLVTKPYIEILGAASADFTAASLLDLNHDPVLPEPSSSLERRIINNLLFKG
jgi:hypothetical protein